MAQNVRSNASRITRYQQKIFSLVLYLIGGDKDEAAKITIASFVETIPQTSVATPEEIFLARLATAAIEKSQDTQVLPAFADADFLDLPAERRKSLQIAKDALHALPFETKAQLLLRDQLHFSYKVIARIFRVSQKAARIQLAQARVQLREKIQEVLRRAQ